MNIKYRFEIYYQTPNCKAVTDFMNKCDLGIGDMMLKDVFTLTYSKEEKPIDYFKDLITQAMEAVGNTVVIIEGGKVE